MDSFSKAIYTFLSSSNYPYWLIGGTCGFAFLLTVVCYTRKYRSKNKLFDYRWNDLMGKPAWSFTTSWATTLTTVGGLLGIVLSSVPSNLSPGVTLTVKTQSVALFFSFSTITLLAPLIYSAIGKHVITESDDGKPTPETQGYVFVFFITSGLTLWAVCGQLVTVSITLHDFANASFTSLPLTIIFIGALLLAIVFVVFYAIETIPWTAQDQLDTDSQRIAQRAELKKISSPSKEIIPRLITPRLENLQEKEDNLPPSKGTWSLL